MVSLFDKGQISPAPNAFNMAAYVLAAGEQAPDKIALETLGQSRNAITYQDLRNRVASTATGLKELGLIEGDRVMLRLGNRVEYPLAYLACIWAGFVPIPTSAQLGQAEVDALAQQSSPALAITEAGIAAPKNIRAIDRTELTQLTALSPLPPVMGDPNRLAYIIFTSGTSGKPRGVCHAHRAIWARQMMFDDWYGLTSDDCLLHAGAFNWTYTMGTGLMDPWTIGATALIPEDGTQPSALPGLIDEAKATIFAAAPGVYRKMLPHVETQFKELKHGLSAGEHLSESIRRDWNDRTGTELHQALGMSECSTFISSAPANPAPANSSGRPQTGRRIAILKDSKPVPFDTDGDLAISTSDPGLMLHYLNEPAPAGLWFLTGDQASMSPDGSIMYLGRDDDMMNAGGIRVSPLEVEAVFAKLPQITSCAAVEVEIKADTTVIALYYSGKAVEQDLRTYAEQNLARYKQPRLYIPQTELPYGANGKLNRRALRASFEAS